MELLSAPWVAERLRLGSVLPATPGATAVVQHMVTDGPNGTVQYWDDIRDGILTDSAIGVHAAPSAVIHYRWPVELAMLRGEIDPVGGVLSGRIRIEGDMNSLLPLVPVLQTSDALEVQRTLDGVTSA